MADHCPRCDKPIATDADYDAIPEGQGDHLCWRAWNGDECDAEPVDWRARFYASQTALAGAEAELAEARAANAIHVDAGRRGVALWREAHPDAPTFPDGAELVAWLLERAAGARAVLDAIRAVPVGELFVAASKARGLVVEAVRARLLAAGEAAAEGRR